MRTRSHSPAPSGPGLSQIAFDTPSRPRPCTSPARRSVTHGRRRRGRASRPPRPTRSATAAGVPERVRRLEVDEVGDRQRAPRRTARRRQATASAGSAAITASQVLGRVEPGEDRRRRRAHSNAHERRDRTACPRRLRRARRRVDAADAVRDLDELGELRDPRRDRDLRSREVARPALAVPALVRCRRAPRARRPADRAARPASAPTASAARSSRRGRGGRRPRTRARPHPMQRRVPGAEQPHHGDGALQRSAARSRTCRP